MVFLGLSLGSGLLAQQPQEFPTYRQLKEEQRIILNAYLIRGENPYLLQAQAQFGSDNLVPAEQNALSAVLLLGRARERLNEHPTKIETARNAMGFRLSESDREELRKSVRDEIDPRYFRLQTALQDVAKKFAAKGITSIQQALNYAQTGNSKGVERIMIDKGINVEKDVLPSTGGGGAGAGGAGAGGTGTGGGSGGTGMGGGGMGGAGTPSPLAGIAGATVVQSGNDTVLNVNGVPVLMAGCKYDQATNTITTPDGLKINAATITKDAFGNLVGISDKGPVYFDPKDGKWKLGTPTGPGGATGGGGGGPGGLGGGGGGRGGPITDPNTGQEISDSDLSDGVLRRYIGEKGGLLIGEQKITVDKNPDGTPKGINLAERRLWKFRLNPGDQKSAGGAVTQTISLVEDGGSAAFSVTGWEAVSSDGRRATVEPSRTNPKEAVVTFPGNGTYTVTASGMTTGWEKGSAFKVKGNIPVFQ